MVNLSGVSEDIRKQLIKALDHLDYSYNKIKESTPDVNTMDEETLETWESFCARFCRVADIFLMKYIKATINTQDPGFRGTFKDHLLQAEKLEVIADVNSWMKIRELRNIVAHEYSVQDINTIMMQIKDCTPQLLEIRQVVNQ